MKNCRYAPLPCRKKSGESSRKLEFVGATSIYVEGRGGREIGSQCKEQKSSASSEASSFEIDAHTRGKSAQNVPPCAEA